MTSTGCTRKLQIGACRIKIILKYHKGLTSQTHAFHPRVIITTPQQKSLRTKSHFWIQLCHKGKRSNSTSILDVGTWHFKPSEAYTFHVLPPIRGQEGLHKRRSPFITQNKFFKRKLSKPTRRIPKAPYKERISTEFNNSNSL